MNFSMMFKKWMTGFLFACFLALLPWTGLRASASEIEEVVEDTEEIPDGDILIVYSNGASQGELEGAMKVVELLTYQSFKVSFGSAGDCEGQLERFPYVIFYEMDRCSNDFFEEMYGLEQQTEITHFFFMGNEGLKNYLDYTGRRYSYREDQRTVGSLTYQFNELNEKMCLVEDKNFLFLQDTADYSTGLIEVGEITDGYLCARSGVLTHFSISDLNINLVQSAFVKEVAQWKWPYKGAPHTYAQYIVINQVYPFQDPDKLLEIVNQMISMEEPFVISVMPVYVNGNYPAMQHFCEVLRYAQDNGAVIIMHSPINQQLTFDVERVNEYITTALQNYMNQGVYPMALQVPENWLFNEDTISVMSRFKTIFTTEEIDENIAATEGYHTNQVYKDGHQWVSTAIPLDDMGTSYTMVASTAVYIDLSDEEDDIYGKIRACQESFVPLKSLWDIEHSFWSNEDILSYKNHIILVNGERVDRDFVQTEYDEKFEYKRNMIQRFSADLSEENQKLVVVVVIVVILFLFFILRARRQNKEKFVTREKKHLFRKKRPDHPTEEE